MIVHSKRMRKSTLMICFMNLMLKTSIVRQWRNRAEVDLSTTMRQLMRANSCTTSLMASKQASKQMGKTQRIGRCLSRQSTLSWQASLKTLVRLSCSSVLSLSHQRVFFLGRVNRLECFRWVQPLSCFLSAPKTMSYLSSQVTL